MININTFLTCPKCHRMTEARVAVCDITTGGCGYEVPVAAVEQAAEFETSADAAPSTDG